MHNFYYSSYNSIINEGQRIRRMRRTELSTDKIICLEYQNQYQTNRDLTNNQSKSCRSLPKVQVSRSFKNIHKKNERKRPNEVYNEYFPKPNEGRQLRVKITPTGEPHRNSFAKNETLQAKADDGKSSKLAEQYSADGMNSKISKSRKVMKKNESIYYSKKRQVFGKSSIMENNENQFSSSRQSQSEYSANCTSKMKKNSQFSKINEYGQSMNQSSLKNEAQKSKIKKPSIYSNLKNSSYKQSSIRNSHLGSQISKIRFQNQQEEEDESDFEEEEGESAFSKLESNGGSVLKFISGNGTSQMKKNSSFRETIKSLASVSILKQKKDSSLEQEKPRLNQRMSLKLESIRNEKHPETNQETGKMSSYKNLPLTSRSQSQRKSLAGESVRSRPMGNSLEEVIERIEIHEFIITLLNDFAEQTVEFYEGEDGKYERLCFLLERKHFLEKSNLIKALKGTGRNVFNLSSIQIPTEILKKYLNNKQIKQIIEQHEQAKMKLFRNLQKFYKQIKHVYKQDPYVKLQTPYDNFSQQIVIDLSNEIQDLYPMLQTLTGEKLQLYEDRIIEAMQKIFVLSQFAGRKVKKLQFSEEIEDFEAYYESNFQNLKETVQFFESLQN